MADEEIIDNEFKFLNLDSKIEYIGGKKEQTLEIPSSQLKYHVTANDLNQIASSFNEFTTELNDTYNFNINITSGLINKLDETIDSNYTSLNNTYETNFATLSENYSKLLTSNISLNKDYIKLTNLNADLNSNANTISGNISKLSGETNIISSNVNIISGNIDTISSDFDSFTDTISGIIPNLLPSANVNSIINEQLTAYIPADSASSVVSSIIEEIKSEKGDAFIIPGFDNLKMYITEYYPETNNTDEFIENIDTTSSWYKLYNTGLLEQGGFIEPILNGNTYQVINLLRPFKSAQIKSLVNAEFVSLNGSALTVLPNNLNETIYYEVYGVQSSIENKDLTFKTISNNLVLTEAESTENENTQTFAIAFTANNTDNLALSYRINAENASENIDWQTYSLNEIIILKEGDKIQFKNESVTNFNEINGHFLTSGDFEVYGNINSLVNYQNNIDTVSFGQLFENTNIINASQLTLSYTKLSDYCYYGMFKNCIKLVYPPELPAIELAGSCYWSMFQGCTSLAKAPKLPATTLADFCYYHMFDGCTSLTEAPELPATTLAYTCYKSMFYNCTSLVEAPELPATTLDGSCYVEMFARCENLIKAPELPATTLVDSCYYSMFEDCTSLNDIKVGFTNWHAATYATTNWLKGVSTTGIFKCGGRLNTNIERSDSTIPANWIIEQLLYFVPTIEPITFNHSIKLKITENSQDNFNNLYYRIGFTNSWSDWYKVEFDSNTTEFIIELSEKSKDSIQLWNFNNYLNNENQQLNILIHEPTDNTNVNIQGNIQSLLNNSTELKSYCFYNLFNTGITNNAVLNIDYSLLQLPVTNLTANCYDSMFKNNTNLSAAPVLPAKNLVRFCYNEMFSGCSKLDYLNVGFLDWKSSLYATKNWLTNTAENGKIDFNFEGEFSMENSLQLCYGESFIHNENWEVPIEFAPLTITSENNFFRLFFSFPTNDLNSQNNAKLLCENLYFRTFENNVWSQWYKNKNWYLEPDEIESRYILEIQINENDKNACLQIWNPLGDCSYNTHNEFRFHSYGIFNKYSLIKTISGNIQSLLNGSNIITPYCFSNLFNGCSMLVDASKLLLPATELADYCYAHMFEDCKSLSKAPELPATTLADYCYAYMFNGCTSLALAPELPATNLAISCYYAMFEGCTNLTTAPELTATKLANSCYYGMFNGCTSLTLAPELPATTLAKSCYYAMFEGCTSLTVAPELPATNLAESCYYGMFKNCTSLALAPELPATNLAYNYSCYAHMFNGCTNLTTAPELPATTTAADCYRYMFYGCTSLNYIKVGFTDWNTTNSFTDSWINNVSPSGTFICKSELPTKRGINYIPENWNIETIENPLTFTAEEANSTIKLAAIGLQIVNGLQYRLGISGEWFKYEIDTVITLNNIGDTVQFQNTNSNLSTSYIKSVTFKMTGKIAASGNIQSMLNYSDSCTPYCYTFMFSGCTSLTKAPELPATNLANDCYDSMFADCANLTKAPELPATRVADFCYYHMFKNCTSLTKAPELPATNLANECYGWMFEGCTSLTKAPELPATNLAVFCYNSMFEGCTSLTKAPELLGKVLADNCYHNMFKDCTSLTKAPELSATTLAYRCYDSMFDGCTSLNYIKVGFTDWNPTNTVNGFTQNWVYNVSSTGTFVCPNTLSIKRGVDYIPEGWTIETIDTPLTFTAEEANSTIKLIKYGSLVVNGLQYRLGTSGEWIKYEIDTVITLNNISDSVQFQNTNSSLSEESDEYVQFVMTGKISASGDVQSMHGYSKYCTQYCYYNMFKDCTSLTKVPELSATRLARYCYAHIFEGCTSLTKAPELPVTELAYGCYYSMFNNCTSLVEAPELPATTLANECYGWMFSGCLSLTKAPELHATILAGSCYYNMFNNCTGLVEAPKLPATTLAGSCYSHMFANCTSLTKAPELHATTLAGSCYYGMFDSCTSLTEAPKLPATNLTNNCYEGMFSGCTSLVEAPELPATTLVDYCYYNMFSNCTSLIKAPELPATTLVDGCYENMFNGCTSLEKAPELPATTLISGSYKSMFEGCMSLEKAPELPATNILNKYDCYKNMFKGCASLTEVPYIPIKTASRIGLASGCFEGMFEGCSGLVLPITEDGNILTLSATTVYQNSYKNMFKDCVNLVIPPTVSATTLASGCFEGMFEGCSNLGNLSNYYIPGTKAGSTLTAAGQSYKNMFKDCINLTYPPMMSGIAGANGAEAFAGMYMNCSSLIEPPLINNINSISGSGKTTAYNICSSMFEGCTSLTSACIPKATTLNVGCYTSMYKGCTSLTGTSILPATTLASSCYNAMFSDCTSLTKAPELLATTLKVLCYADMFSNCTNLNYVKVKFTNWNADNSSTVNWLENVSTTGTFVCPTNLDTSNRGIHYIPEDWDIEKS